MENQDQNILTFTEWCNQKGYVIFTFETQNLLRPTNYVEEYIKYVNEREKNINNQLPKWKNGVRIVYVDCITCPCGSIVQKCSKSIHMKTRKHLDWMDSHKVYIFDNFNAFGN